MASLYIFHRPSGRAAIRSVLGEPWIIYALAITSTMNTTSVAVYDVLCCCVLRMDVLHLLGSGDGRNFNLRMHRLHNVYVATVLRRRGCRLTGIVASAADVP